MKASHRCITHERTWAQISKSERFWPLSIHPSLLAMFMHEMPSCILLIAPSCLDGCVHVMKHHNRCIPSFTGSASSRWHESSHAYPEASASHACNEGGCASISHLKWYGF